jgi:hypothetical protein
VTTTANISLVGVEDAIKALRKIDPELRKQFNRDAKDIAAPAIQAAQNAYPEMPLSGMARQWQSKGRILFPYVAAKARRGAKVKVDTSRKTRNVILIQQADPGAVIFETAGRRTSNVLGRNLGVVAPAETRVLSRAVDANRARLEAGFERLVRDVMRTVEKDANQ